MNKKLFNIEYSPIVIAEDVTLTYITVITGIVGAIIASSTFYYQRKRNQHDVLFQVFSLLNNNHKRNARIRVVRLNKESDEKEKLNILKKLDLYDRSKIDEKTKDLKSEDSKVETLKNLIEANERESKNEVKWDFEHVGGTQSQ